MLLMTKGLLVTGSQDYSIKVWKFDDLQNAKCIKTINDAHKVLKVLGTFSIPGVNSLLELPGNILASGCWGGYIKFWNFNDDYKNYQNTNNVRSLTMTLVSQK